MSSWIIRRARELAPRWEELAAELRYGYEGGFYLYGPRARSPTPPRTRARGGPEPVPGSKRLAVPTDAEAPGRRWVARLLDGLGRLFPVTRDTVLRRALARLAAWADRQPAVAQAVERLELAGEAAALRLPGLRQLRPRATWSTCAPRPAPSTSATARAAAPISGTARSSTSRASGWACTRAPAPRGDSTSWRSTFLRPTARSRAPAPGSTISSTATADRAELPLRGTRSSENARRWDRA